MPPLSAGPTSELILAFVAAASGSEEQVKREPGISLTRHELRLLRGFAAEGHELPTGALSMEKHVGYRFCGIAGTEPTEMLHLYNELRSHAGTWPFHEDRLRVRGEQLLFEARYLVDDLREVEEALRKPGEPDTLRIAGVLRGAQERAAEEAHQVHEAAQGLTQFAEHTQGVLIPAIDEKIAIAADSEHDTDNYMQRARLRRLLGEVLDAERVHQRVLASDESIVGRDLRRSVYGEAATAAEDALFEALHAYKKCVAEVAVPFRLRKSVGSRRVALGNAAFASRSAAHALHHLARVWTQTAESLQTLLDGFEAAKSAGACLEVAEAITPLAAAWEAVLTLSEVHEDVFG